MELILTIEIGPYDFARNDYKSPRISLEEGPEAWNDFWLKSIADSGLGNLKAVKKGSYLVDITTINETELEIILQQQLADVEWEFFEEQIAKLSGGIICKENNQVHIEPMCCGDLGNTKDWEQIIETGSHQWKQLWIGHPWIFYRKNNDIIEFSDYTESNIEDFKDNKPVFFVSETDLKNQLSKIRKQQNVLEHNIQKILEKMDISHSVTIAKMMTGNE